MRMKMLGVAVFLGAVAVLGIGAGVVVAIRDVLAHRRERQEEADLEMLERMMNLTDRISR